MKNTNSIDNFITTINTLLADISDAYTIPHDYSNIYDELLSMSMRLTSNDTPEITDKRITSCINWLHTTDFYSAPASTKYHDSCEQGLVIHSLKVAKCSIDLWRTNIFSTVSPEQTVLVALIHDWCKINAYEPYYKNVKDDNTGTWNKQLAYKFKDNPIPLGHGTASMYIASKFIRLSLEEALAVRWHMSAWHVDDSEKSELQLANSNYPLVHLLQFADQLAITNYVK